MVCKVSHETQKQCVHFGAQCIFPGNLNASKKSLYKASAP